MRFKLNNISISRVHKKLPSEIQHHRMCGNYLKVSVAPMPSRWKKFVLTKNNSHSNSNWVELGCDNKYLS